MPASSHAEGRALGFRLSITSLAQRPPGTGQRITATQPSLDPEMETGEVSASGNRRHGPQIRGLRPQGPGTSQWGEPTGVMAGKFLVSAELPAPSSGHRRMAGAGRRWSEARTGCAVDQPCPTLCDPVDCKLPYPSPSPGACSNSRPLSW